MKTITIPSLLAIMVFVLAACAPATAEILPPTLLPSATDTITPSPTNTSAPTKVPATSVPRPTVTPSPVAFIVTSIPSGSRFPSQITGPVGQDYKNLGIPQSLWFERVAWVKDVRIEYGGGSVLLSGSSNGASPLVVDDVLIIKILHENGKFDEFEYDFSRNSTIGRPQEKGPFDLTAFFRDGVNMLYVTIYDYGYSYWGTPGLWIVEFR